MFWRSAFQTSEFFIGDIGRRRLANQLSMMHDVCNRKGSKISSIIGALAALGKGRELFSEVLTLLQLYYVLPASSATAVLVAATSEDLYSDNNDADGLNNLMALHVPYTKTCLTL